MLSCCCFCSGKFQSPRTEPLSCPPSLYSLPSESSCLLPCLPMLLLLHTASSFFLRISLLITEVKNISGDPGLFPATFLLKYLTSCISHFSIVGSNYDIDVHDLISQSNEWGEFPTCPCLKGASHIWVPQYLKIKPYSWLVWLSRLLQSNSKGHHHQVLVTSYVCSRRVLVLLMLTPIRKRFFTNTYSIW